tara:strand:- start:2461 stop:3027 length:567 start_codon:yes stop_codon:yes gene_type:complete
MLDINNWIMTGHLPTFGIKTWRDMLKKLHWELDRLAEIEDHDHETAAYHCFNAAVTAWHLHEWIWLDIKQNSKLRAQLAREAGIWPQKFEKGDWHKFVQNHETFAPVLRYCRIIVTATKHGGVKFTDEDPTDIEVYTSTSSTLRDNTGRKSQRWKIRIKDRVIPAEFVLDAAGDVWRTFIEEHLTAGD